MNVPRLVAILLLALLPLGCAAKVPQLNARLSDEELKESLAANFHEGMTLPEVNSSLSALNVSWDVRRAYASTPPQLLVRLFPIGGFWVENAEYQKTRYVDAWFIFTPQPVPTLAAIDLEPRVVRIQAHTYIDPPFQNPNILPRDARPVPAGVGEPGRDWITIGSEP
jgi:hypothetical protein